MRINQNLGKHRHCKLNLPEGKEMDRQLADMTESSGSEDHIEKSALDDNLEPSKARKAICGKIYGKHNILDVSKLQVR